MYNKTSTMRAVLTKFSDAQVAAFVRLFKIAPASAKSPHLISATDAIATGLVFVDNHGNILDHVPQNIFRAADSLYGNHARLFNETFYKSFSTVRDASPYKLLFDQLAHYFTTYGAESLGLKMPTYVPLQKLELPENQYNSDFRITVIQILPDEDCIARINNYLKSLTAPSSAILECVTELLTYVTIPTDDIKSFEVQVIKHEMDGTVPSAPVSQLRYIVYTVSGQTILIKNRSMRETIKSRAAVSGDTAYNLFTKCDLTGLASIFLRYKPIFLAFKTHNKCAPFINFLRRKADLYHKPLNTASLQNFTSITDVKTQIDIVSKASNRELIKLLNSINSRLAINGTVPGVYSIRNGRTFVKEDGLTPQSNLHPHASLVVRELTRRLSPVLQGKIFYIPDYIEYTVPTTEKQFVGNIPYGTKILGTPESALTLGIHWVNQGGRTDIDLHMNSATEHFGWNGSYRNGIEILYTGDLTDAPQPYGAAEAFWFVPQNEAYIVTANLYSGASDAEFKLFMTEKKPVKTGSSRSFGYRRGQNEFYTYDPNEAIFPAIPLNFAKENALTIGMFAEKSFYFYGGTLSNGIVPSANYGQFIDGLTAQLKTKTSMRSMLRACGAIVVGDADRALLTKEQFDDMISLAPEDLTIDTLMGIIDGNL